MRLVPTQLLATLRRLVAGPESLMVALVVALVEMVGPSSQDDVDDIPWVLLLPMLLMFGCSMARYRSLPVTTAILDLAVTLFHRVRSRLVLSLGLDFHPDRSPRLPPFTSLRRLLVLLVLAAFVLAPAQGVLRELLAATRVRGLYTFHVIGLGAVWATLAAGIVVVAPAVILGVLEVLKRRARFEGPARVAAVVAILALVTALLVSLDAAVGITGCLGVLAFACVLPSVVRPVDPPRGPWLNIAVGRTGRPRTARLGEVVRDLHRLLALGAFTIVCVLAPTDLVSDELFPATDVLLRVFGWLSAWLFTGGALLAVAEFNRRRRLFDPAFERSRVLWAIPGPEASALELERAAIAAAGWRLVIDDRMPDGDDADLLVGLPRGLVPPSTVPLSRIPPAVFLLSDDPGALLDEAEERDKAERCALALERLLVSARPRVGDRGEGTFLVPHCWLVVGLTRDDDKGGLDRPPALSFGQSFQAVLGTRLRRFLYEVMSRSGVDVFYVEDAVTPQQVSEVLGLLFERHIARTEPAELAEHEFVGVTGVRVVLHDVDPEGDGIAGVDAHVTRNAISRARIMIIGKDRRDDDDDDGPPESGESNDLWLRESLRTVFDGLRPVGSLGGGGAG